MVKSLALAAFIFSKGAITKRFLKGNALLRDQTQTGTRKQLLVKEKDKRKQHARKTITEVSKDLLLRSECYNKPFHGICYIDTNGIVQLSALLA